MGNYLQFCNDFRIYNIIIYTLGAYKIKNTQKNIIFESSIAPDF
jgi:hypothetical protein